MEYPTLPESLSNRNQAIQELIQAQESIKNLNDLLWKPQKIEASPILEDGVVVRILEIFENTLSIMKSCNSNEPLQHVTSKLHSSCASDGMQLKKPDESQSQVSPAKNKRRKTSWTSTQVTSVLVDDGHAWRKYGQKQILNFKHQRSYYRCTYKFDRGCLATKHVQKIQDNPSKYRTTYIRNHTCNNLLRTPPIILDSMNSTDTSMILSFSTNRFIEPKNVDPPFKFVKNELDEGFPPLGNINPNYLSPFSISHTHVPGVPSEPTSTTELSRLDHGNMVPLRVHSGLDHEGMTPLDVDSSMTDAYGYEMDHRLIWETEPVAGKTVDGKSNHWLEN